MTHGILDIVLSKVGIISMKSPFERTCSAQKKREGSRVSFGLRPSSPILEGEKIKRRACLGTRPLACNGQMAAGFVAVGCARALLVLLPCM